MTALEITAYERAGAEVLGCDLSNQTVGESDQIAAAFASFGLLVFRDQVLDQQELVDIASRFGSATKAASDGPRGQWHSGKTGLSEPMLGTLSALHGRDSVPDTRFASTYLALDFLSSATRNALEGLYGLHVYDAMPAAPVRHPLVIRHPLSGRKALFVNPSTTSGIDGMGDEAGLALLNELFEHGQGDDCVETVSWEPGTVILWDSRAFWRFESAESDPAQFVTMEISGVPLSAAVPRDTSDPSLVQRAGATLAGGIITAAMTGIAEVIEPERVRPDVEIVAEAPDREPLDDGFDFGDLPPLE